MAKALVLRAITGTQAGKRHVVTARVSSIGTAASNDLVLHDRLLNPRHIELRQVLERWFVVPLASNSQGLALNGMPISGQSRLNPGDALTLGSVTYMVDLEDVIEQEVGQAPAGNNGVPRLGEYFIRRGILSREQVIAVAERQSRLQRDGSRLQFGQVAYDMGFITRSQLDMALADQRSDFNDRFY
ncbi:MAG TPA: FHA domain-containing protein [Kouleothrix sp.]|uniref:FHA domain-containing protein n=1 Tax=Kouleothrix sp. TaxID=2779161 RepID=UPI002B6F819E|nr:FHA domain-containing protein [Kouleothrix sp.]HRC77129.1 FHA domain-containing protein [Kouleothrix sp.]